MVYKYINPIIDAECSKVIYDDKLTLEERIYVNYRTENSPVIKSEPDTRYDEAKIYINQSRIILMFSSKDGIVEEIVKVFDKMVMDFDPNYNVNTYFKFYKNDEILMVISCNKSAIDGFGKKSIFIYMKPLYKFYIDEISRHPYNCERLYVIDEFSLPDFSLFEFEPIFLLKYKFDTVENFSLDSEIIANNNNNSSN